MGRVRSHPPPREETLGEAPTVTQAARASWRTDLPVTVMPEVTLRELRIDDGPSLLAHLSVEEVSRFISPPPTTIAGYEQFIARCHQDRTSGQGACFGIVPSGAEHAVGIFQLRSLDASFHTAEWGFAMGSAYWGSGLFLQCATRVLDFAFDVVGVLRLEARAAVVNGRGNGALRKTGAVQEGVLRRSFKRGNQSLDQVLWSILSEDWLLQRGPQAAPVH